MRLAPAGLASRLIGFWLGFNTGTGGIGLMTAAGFLSGAGGIGGRTDRFGMSSKGAPFEREAQARKRR